MSKNVILIKNAKSFIDYTQNCILLAKVCNKTNQKGEC